MSPKFIYYTIISACGILLILFIYTAALISDATDGKTPKSILAAEVLNIKVATLDGKEYEFGSTSRECKRDKIASGEIDDCSGFWSDQDIATDVCSEFHDSLTGCIVLIANSKQGGIDLIFTFESETHWICTLLADENLSIGFKLKHTITELSKEFRCELQENQPIETFLAFTGATDLKPHHSETRQLHGMELTIMRLNPTQSLN